MHTQQPDELPSKEFYFFLNQQFGKRIKFVWGTLSIRYLYYLQAAYIC